MTLGMLQAVAEDVELQDHTVVHQTVDRRCGGHGIFKDSFPFRKGEIGCDHDAAPLVTMGQQGKQHPSSLIDQFQGYRAEKMGFPTAWIPQSQNILSTIHKRSFQQEAQLDIDLSR